MGTSAVAPFYLQTANQGIGMVDFQDDFSYIKSSGESSFWQDIASGVDSGVTTVFDKASGAWKSVKTEIASTAGEVGGGLTKILDTIKENILFVVIIGLVIIYVVAKTGILHQIAEVLP